MSGGTPRPIRRSGWERGGGRHEQECQEHEGRKAGSTGQLWLRLPGLVREALYETVIGAGLACVDEVLEAERVALCGERYAHLVDREASRAGHVASSLVLGGRRVAVNRPRVRSAEGHELKLPSWQEWSARDPLQQRAVEQMVLGVSTRRYARSLEPLPEAITARGTSKSAVSERFVYGTERKLAELMSRELRAAPIGSLANRWRALRRACGAGGGGS